MARNPVADASSCSAPANLSAELPLFKDLQNPKENILETTTDPVIDAAAVQSPQQPRASPAPVPNGKPASPYVKESNPMGTGAAQTVSSKDPKAAAAAATDMRNVVRRKLTGYVGFANLPNQWHRKSVRKGFSFNVMVVGMSCSSATATLKINIVRRVWAGQVYSHQHSFQHFTLSST